MNNVAKKTAKADVQNPHDIFFGQSFRHHDVAAGEMIRVLSPHLVQFFDLENLALDETSLLDAKYKSLFSDRLFRVPLKDSGEVFVWILIEHQSTDQHMMPLRLLEYAAARWRAYRMLHKDARQIPLLIPIVIQHDKKGWTAPTAFSDLYDVPPDLLQELGRYAIDFHYLLDDLQAESDEDIAARCPSVALQAVLLALKNGGHVKVNQTSKWSNLFTQLANEGNIDLVEDLLWYFIQRSSETLVQRIQKENPTMQQTAENMLDRKFKEGVRLMLRTTLTAKPDFHVTDEIEAKLQAASVHQMQQWVTRLVLGESPNDVLGF